MVSMITNDDHEITNLKKAIAAMEAQRATLGEEVVEAGLASMRMKIAELEKRSTAPEQERKLVTILFADVVGSTRLSQHLEPDHILEIMDSGLKRLASPVEAYGGHVSRFMGDGFQAVFGTPVAHEDDPARAVRAGLQIIQEAQAYAQELKHRWELPSFQIRVGINTGVVAIGGQTEFEDTMMGLTVNLAARLESAAPPDGVLISLHTYKQVGALVEAEKHPAIHAKGFDEPVPVFLVKAMSAHPEAKRALGAYDISSPLVGRDEELKALAGALQRLKDGHGGIVGIIAEAGLGKSRLVEESHRSISGDHYLWLEGNTRIDGRSITYWPFREILRQQAGISEDDNEDQAWEKLDRSVSELLPDDKADILPYLASLLNLRIAEEYAERVKYLDGDAMRGHIFYAFRQLFVRLSQMYPVILVFEDLHWMDEASTKLLMHLLPLSQQVPLLTIGTSRPYRDSPVVSLWGFVRRDLPDCYLELRLLPLSPGESSQMVEKLLQIESMSTRGREMIIQKAGGNPFYVEEVIRSLIDNRAVEWNAATGRWKATQHIDLSYIPDTIQGLIAARIDRLGNDIKRVLRNAAVIGQSFPYSVLRAVASKVPNLDTRLLELQQVEMIMESRAKPELEFRFKHALVQEVVYESIVLQKRKALHGRVGQAIEDLYGDRLDEYYVLLAYHYAQSEAWEKAQYYLLKAGDQAGRLAADAEALTIYQQAIAAYVQAFGDEWDTLQRANLDRKIGEAYTRQGDIDQALANFHRAMSLLDAPFPTSPLQVRLAIVGESLRQTIQRLVPRLFSKRGASIESAVVDEEIYLYEDLGWIYVFQNAERFILCMLKELNLSERQKNPFGIAMASSGFGIVFDLIPIYPLAQIYHRIAMRRVEKTENPIAKGQVYFGLSVHEFYQGDIDGAIESANRSLEFYSKAGDLHLIGQGKAALALGVFQKGDLSQLAMISEELVRLGQESNVPQSWGHGLHFQGVVLRLQGKMDQAIHIQKQAGQMAEKVMDSQAQVLIRAELALCYLYSGLLAEALALLRELEDTKRGDNSLFPHAIGRVIYAQTTAYLTVAEGSSGADREKWLREANRSCRESIKFIKSLPVYLSEALFFKGKYEWLRGKTDKARRYWHRSLAEAESLGMSYALAMTHFEMGYRFGEREHLEKAGAIFSDIGAEYDAARTRKLLDRRGDGGAF
jgi:class 3 adenylate cyclase/tetratricopeptide (TPR) repeat protein